MNPQVDKPSSNDHRAYEESDARPLPVMAVAGSLMVLIGLLLIFRAPISAFFYADREIHRSTPAVGDVIPMSSLPPSPRLEVIPGQAFRVQSQTQIHVLNTFSRDADGQAHVPIERAMSILVKRGFPMRSRKSDSKP